MWAFFSVIVGGIGLFGLGHFLSWPDVAKLRVQAENFAQAGEWGDALRLWRQINATSASTGKTHLGEGRACLALGQAADAERSLRRAVSLSPNELEAWLLLLEIMRVEDRQLDALELGWRGLDQLSAANHTPVLRELTLAILTDLPDDLARRTLRRWIEADASDLEARVALHRRIGAEPRSDDPDRRTRLTELFELLSYHPHHNGLRETLVMALADAGNHDKGRELLDDWPAGTKDARYWRLRGRWDLEYDHRAKEAVEALQKALTELPHDWRTHYRLARVLRILNRSDEAHKEAEIVSRIRELLDPLALGPKLDAAFSHLDQPEAFDTLADTCARVGLSRLADAWRILPRSQSFDRPDGNLDAIIPGPRFPATERDAP
jgi:tetratricopeptide (TPR) repeat protein